MEITDKIAAVTSVTLSTATVAGVFMAATAPSLSLTAVYGITALGGAALSTAAWTAWADKNSTTPEKYFKNFQKHAVIAVVATGEMVNKVLITGMVEAVSAAVKDLIYTKISGNKPHRIYV